MGFFFFFCVFVFYGFPFFPGSIFSFAVNCIFLWDSGGFLSFGSAWGGGTFSLAGNLFSLAIKFSLTGGTLFFAG